MSRSVAEWIGRTDDAKVPDSVRLRIFRDAKGFCHISGRQIQTGEKWTLEHVVPLWTVPTRAGEVSGLHRESNLRPALEDKEGHKTKTAEETTARARADAAAKRHLGITAPGQKIQSRGFALSNKEAKRAASRAFYEAIAPTRRLYTEEGIQ